MIRVAVQEASELRVEPHDRLSDAGIRKLVRASLAPHAGEGQVTVRLVGEVESRELNHRWRGSDRPTNVLAFPAERELGEIGDIVICLPLVRSEAGARGCTCLDHLAHLVVHGCLHLVGHDHQQPDQARRMEARESELLVREGWRDPWKEERA